jgi:outer membrane protein OmpA-like peptidoglycan-associated protein
VLPFDEAVVAAANTLLSGAAQQTKERRVLVIDPLIDAVSGMESAQTRVMERRIVDLAKEKFPQFDVQPFSVSSVAKLPIVLVGTFTPIDAKNQVRTTREQFRICLALADMGSGKILSKGVARSQLDGIDSAPTGFYRDSPLWSGEDPAITGYVRTCQATKPGDPIDPVYLQSIATAALVNEAIDLFEAQNFKASNELFRGAAQTPAGKQLRVLNGWFLSSWNLNRRNEAAQAAGRLAEYGLERRSFSMMFLFPPGRAEFTPDRRVSGAYPILLREVAQKTVQTKDCLEVVGHASRSGTEPANEKLSLARANFVRAELERSARPLAKRMTAVGVGSREWMVGTGSDDLVDAIDRRVQIKVANCPA